MQRSVQRLSDSFEFLGLSREMKSETAALTSGLTAVDIVLPGTSFPFLDHLPKLLLVVTALRSSFLVAGSDHVAAVCLHPIVASVKVRRVWASAVSCSHRQASLHKLIFIHAFGAYRVSAMRSIRSVCNADAVCVREKRPKKDCFTVTAP